MNALWFLLAPFLAAQTNYSANLAWDVNPSAAGYRVYYGSATLVYTNMLEAGSTNFLTVSNLTTGIPYYFAATDYDTNGLESQYSQEISFIKPSPVSQGITLVFNVPQSGSYIIQASPDLKAWSNVSPPLTASGSSVSMFIYIDSNVPQIYYRAKLVQ